MELSDYRVTRFSEAPVLPHWINAGVYLFEPEITDLSSTAPGTVPASSPLPR